MNKKSQTNNEEDSYLHDYVEEECKHDELNKPLLEDITKENHLNDSSSKILLDESPSKPLLDDYTSCFIIDSSLRVDSTLRKCLVASSTLHTDKVHNVQSPFSCQKFFFLLDDLNIIKKEEVHARLFRPKIPLDEEINKENVSNTLEVYKYSLTSRHESSCFISHESSSSSLPLDSSQYLKSTNILLKSSTDSKFKINLLEMDERTTCMIKNIPNKYTQKMLISLLNEHHFGCFDFVYLRMDFKNKCNVGYAFVNFTSKEHIVTFYKKINNKGWKLFSSNKIAELTYASIQGISNLVDKFRNSLVMKEQESYRPKIFYTEGYLKGVERKMI
ncbi:meiosis protein MEI2 (MEI2) [Vairimorpha necatrix]|uniref:Meiosis protein MEI2 (MEI2) n=1 Tax=Vairimorpha necatrix TaxID=6039 RepID=A0AAX4J8B2_9MICR